MNITVYLGAREGNEPVFRETAKEIGRWIAEAGHRLIYGGSEIGLMGVLANAVMENGGEVIGVLDIDSPIKNRFTEADKEGLEAFVEVLEKAL